jgi:hypothetical protein
MLPIRASDEWLLGFRFLSGVWTGFANQERGLPRKSTLSVVMALTQRPKNYLCTTPQAMRSPELPDGSVFMSSAFAWITSAVPPLLKSE